MAKIKARVVLRSITHLTLLFTSKLLFMKVQQRYTHCEY